MSLYSFGKVVCNAIFRTIFKIKVEGLENIPDDKNFIMVCNHKSNFDPPILGIALPVKLNYMAKEELFKNKFLGGLFRKLGAFPIKRGAKDVTAIKTALKILKSGEVVAMFPEGGRSKVKGMLRKGKQGAALLASRAGVGILPVGISGEYKFRGRLNITVGKFITPDELCFEKDEAEQYQKFTDDVIMPTIAKLAGLKIYENNSCR